MPQLGQVFWSMMTLPLATLTSSGCPTTILQRCFCSTWLWNGEGSTDGRNSFFLPVSLLLPFFGFHRAHPRWRFKNVFLSLKSERERKERQKMEKTVGLSISSWQRPVYLWPQIQRQSLRVKFEYIRKGANYKEGIINCFPSLSNNCICYALFKSCPLMHHDGLSIETK